MRPGRLHIVTWAIVAFWTVLFCWMAYAMDLWVAIQVFGSLLLFSFVMSFVNWIGYTA